MEVEAVEPMGVAGARAPESAEAQRPSGVVALGLGEHLRHGATPQLALTRTRTPSPNGTSLEMIRVCKNDKCEVLAIGELLI